LISLTGIMLLACNTCPCLGCFLTMTAVDCFDQHHRSRTAGP
jgi:hypothetical protein